MIGSARLIFKTMRNGAKKKSKSQKYGIAIIKYFQSLSLNEFSTFISNPDTNYPAELDFLVPTTNKLYLPM